MLTAPLIIGVLVIKEKPLFPPSFKAVKISFINDFYIKI